MKPIALAYKYAGEAVWEAYKQAVNRDEVDVACELKSIALSMGRKATEHCGEPVNIEPHKPLNNGLQKKLKYLARKSLCEQ